MKIKVTCGCGSAFMAPTQLAGQTVRCPSCRKPLTVPAGDTGLPGEGAQAPDREPELDLNELSALDEPSLDGSTLQGSTASRSAINAAGSGGSTVGQSVKDDQAVSQEVDDRMTRMYEVYSGKKMNFGGGSGGKMKLLIGLGIAVLTLGVGASVAWHVLKTEYAGTLDSMGDMIAGNSGDQAAQPTAEVQRKQDANAAKTWNPPDASQLSGVELAGTDIRAQAQDGSRVTFHIRVEPVSKADDRRLSMAASVALFRSLTADGPFTQADRVKVEGFDRATGSLTFELFDAELAGLETNQLYYRLSGFDSDGKRLFDTPPAGFDYVCTPVVDRGRVLWKPRAQGKPLPGLRIGARLDAPGWEGVLLWRVVADGPMSYALPDLPPGLPTVIESAVYRPKGIELDARGRGRWRMQWVTSELDRRGGPGATVVGAAPFAYAKRLDLRMTPSDKPFTSVSRSWDSSNKGAVSRVVMFTPKGEPTQSANVVTPPVLTDVTATAYDGRVHIAWDSTALLAGLDRYAGPVRIAVRRVDDRGGDTLIAQLPADSTGYTDADTANGRGVSYEVSLVQAGAAGADPMVHADAWIQGHGTLGVLTAFPVADSTTRVTPEPGLDRLYVSLGINELSYAGSGSSSVALSDRLIELLAGTPGVGVVDRASLCCFVGAAPLPGTPTDYFGSPAQVQLRLVDSTSSHGDRLSLWASDVATGRSNMLATADADAAVGQADLFVTALKTYLESRMPQGMADTPATGEAPSLVVVGPIYPVDQPVLYYHASDLTERLAKVGDHETDGVPVVSRRFWMDDTQQDPRAIDRSALHGAVLVVGRAWTADHSMPGVSLRAVDAASGRLIDRFEADRLTPQALRDFADWCTALRVLPDTHSAEGSALLTAESSLTPIHPVWRQAASDPQRTGHTYTQARRDTPGGQDAPTLSFGLPMPASLAGLRAVTPRKDDDPLVMLRPYVAPQYPLAFDDWVQAYADYIEADNAAFIQGFEQVRRLQQAGPGPISPQLIVRGEHKFIGDGTIPAAAGGMRITPAALNLRTFFPMGVAQQPMIDYRQNLSQAFKDRPWMLSHAWKRAAVPIAEPFLRGELFGVRDGRYGRLNPPDKPVPLASYIAADLLANLGHREAYTYKQKALALASQALTELSRGGVGNLSAEKIKWATDALLVLVYEKDPGTIKKLADRRFRDRYFSVEPEMQGDVLRMLVDRAGPRAWEWASSLDAVDWDRFVWRSREEMDTVTQAKADLIPQASRLAIRAWLDIDDPTPGDAPDITAASGPRGTPRSN